MAHDLQPCPFCGSEPGIISGTPGLHYVLCRSCDASSREGSRERAIEAWNTRTTLTANPPAQLEVSEEQVAKVLYEATHPNVPSFYSWDENWEEKEVHRGRYYKQARAIIAALHPGGLVVLVGEEQVTGDPLRGQPATHEPSPSGLGPTGECQAQESGQ